MPRPAAIRRRKERALPRPPTPISSRLTSRAPTTATSKKAILEVLPKLSGAFSFTMMDEAQLFGARDPHGFRPLCIGRLPADGWVLASETCALDLLGARFIRDVEPGELVTIDENGITSDQLRARHFAHVSSNTCTSHGPTRP